MKTKKITNNDARITSCCIDSNKISYKIDRAYSILNGLPDADILLMDDKAQAKRLLRLKKLISQANELVKQIDTTYYDGVYLRDREYWY